MVDEPPSCSPAQVADTLKNDAAAFAHAFVLRALRHERNGEFVAALADYNIARPLTWKYRALIDSRIAGIRNGTPPQPG